MHQHSALADRAAAPTADAVKDRDAMAARLAEVAWELAQRLRAGDPAATHEWLMEHVPDGEWPAFAIVLAAHIPADADQLDLLAWWFGEPETPAVPAFVVPTEVPTDTDGYTDEELHTAYVRHRARGVPVDEIDDEIRAGRDRYLASQRRSA